MIPHKRVSFNAGAGGYQFEVSSQNVSFYNTTEEINHLSIFIQH